MGEALARHRGVVDPEPERLGAAARDVGQERVVGVHDRPRRGIEVGDSRAPALGDVLELAVAVELVAEKVPETDGLRPDAAGDVRKRALVDLEEPEVGPVGGEERRRHSRDEIRSRAVVRELHAVSDDLRDHRGGRRLPVRRRDEGRSQREAAGELADGAGVHRGEDLSGNRRTAASAGEP